VRRAGILICLLAASGISMSAQARPTGNSGREGGRIPAALVDADRALLAGDPARALKLAAAHVRNHPGSAEARVIMARVHIERGELGAAYEELRRALAANPRHVDALYYMGSVAGRLAEMEMQRLTEVAPDSARVHQLLAESLEVQERRTEAAAEYQAALERQPDLLDALLGLARLKRTSLECDAAIGLYERAEAVRPTFEGAFGLGVCLQYEQQDDRAIEQFERALKLDPRAPLAWKDLGVSLMKIGRTDEAIRHLQKAISLEPRMHEAHYALGQAYRAAGDPARSQDAFAAAERLQTPSQPPR
jgi:tetratricopeptide (TPR) repeat protein